MQWVMILVASMAFVSCGGNANQGNTSKSKKFNPTERQSSLSDSEREAAILRKRASLDVDIETVLYSHGVRFGIVEPKKQGDITQDIADRIAMKMLQIASENGISGAGSLIFVMGAEIAQTGRAVTGTSPQKMTSKYELTFKVLNTLSGDVYATVTATREGETVWQYETGHYPVGMSRKSRTRLNSRKCYRPPANA